VKDIGLTLLSEGKTIRIKAHGYSMYPCIKPGSLILIEPINIKGFPRRGEIIAIRRESGLIVHRLSKIVRKNGITFYIARGDSNAYADNPVKIDNIAGRIVRAESTGENPVPADIRINTRPNYFVNRIRVIGIFLWKKLNYSVNH
jgi:signal peptidase I